MTVSPEKEYWAFVSYSSKDRKWGEWLHRRLESYTIPHEFRGQQIFDGALIGKHLRPVFRDREELAGSADLGEQIRAALKTSRFLVVVCSRNSAKSQWVNKEIEDFKKLGKEKRILAVILDGEPNASSGPHPEEECFPPALRLPVEPIAGDLRKEGDGRERGFLKVLAGIAQIDFDGLYRRHERRKAKLRVVIGATASVLIVAFATLAGFANLQRIEAERAKERAETQKRIAEETTQFLFGMFESLNPAEAKLREITVREILDEASKTIGDRFDGQPQVEMPIRGLLTVVYRLIGRENLALPHAEEKLRLAREVARGADNDDVADSLTGVALSLAALGRYEGALSLHMQAVEMRRRIHPGGHHLLAMGLNNVAGTLDKLGRTEEAVPPFREALEMQRRIFQGDHPAIALTLGNLAVALKSLGRYEEALPAYREALEMGRRSFKGDHPFTANRLMNLATCLQVMGRQEEALACSQEALEMQRRIFKGDHPDVIAALGNMSANLQAMGRMEEALAIQEEAVAMQKRLFKGDHPGLAANLGNMSATLASMGRAEEALATGRKALEMQKRVFKGDHPELVPTLSVVGGSLLALGRTEEALEVYENAAEMGRRAHKKDHPDTAASLSHVAACLFKLGRPEQALANAKESLAMRKRLFKGDHPAVVQNLSFIGHCLHSMGRVEDAVPAFKEALDSGRRINKDDDPSTALIIYNLAYCRETIGETDAARAGYREALEMAERVLAKNPSLEQMRTIQRSCRAKLGNE